jgi:TRAP-type C4-dicarboxylate transport system substrate-binding protein
MNKTMEPSIMKRGGGHVRRWLGAAALTLLAGVASAQTQTLQFASPFPESDFTSQFLKRWAEGVTRETGGRIQFRMHWAGALVGNKMLDGMRDGVIDGALTFTPYVSGEIIDLAPLEVPFSYPLDIEGLTAFHREALPLVDAIYEKHGSRAVAAPPMLLPDPLTCADRFLSGEDKWKGALVRTAGRWQAESVKRWGGSPVVLAPADLYSALERKTVNCTLMVYNIVKSMKLYEPAAYITRVDHSIAFGSINVSNRTWAKLSEQDRAVMRKVGEELLTWGSAEYTRAYAATIDELKGLGAKFCVPEQKEFDRLVAAANDLLEKEIANKTSPDGTKVIELIKRYRSKVLARPQVGDMTPCP